MVKHLPANAGNIRDVDSIPGSGRSPGGGHGNPLQYSCLENPTDRGVWQATVHMVAKSRTQLKQFSIHVHRELSNGRSRLEKRKRVRISKVIMGSSLWNLGYLWDHKWQHPKGAVLNGFGASSMP